MNFHFRHYHYHTDCVGKDIHQQLENLTFQLTQLGDKLMATVKDVQDKAIAVLAAVQVESDKDDAIIALVEGNTAQLTSLRKQLADAIAGGSDPAALNAVLDSLTTAETSATANAAKVVAAVNANTPSA